MAYIDYTFYTSGWFQSFSLRIVANWITLLFRFYLQRSREDHMVPSSLLEQPLFWDFASVFEGDEQLQGKLFRKEIGVTFVW